jgi:phosphoribosylamine---glycine ligase
VYLHWPAHSSQHTLKCLKAAIATCESRTCLQVKVLLLGGGGREHALAWKLAQSPQCSALYCAPGNPGIAAEPKVTIAPGVSEADHGSVVSFCKSNDIGLVFVGPEAPLVSGVVDALREAEVTTFGPGKAAAQLEGSKEFMKVCPSVTISSA